MLVRVVNPKRVEITGYDPSQLDRVAAFAEKLAARLQERMAKEFENEKNFAGALKANNPDYTLSKVEAGDDPRRGHKTGELQQAMYDVELWSVRAGKKRTVITFSETKLNGSVAHAEYYAEAKARQGQLVGVKAAWAKAVPKPKLKVIKTDRSTAMRRELTSVQTRRGIGRTSFGLRGV